MSDNPSTANGSSALDSQEIECRVEAFLTALNRGQRPCLDEFLPSGGDAVSLLVELIHIELEHRLKQGEAARVEEYLLRYPHLAGDSALVVDLAVAEYTFRLRCEADLNGEAFLQRFAEVRDALAVRLDDVSTQPLASEEGSENGSHNHADTLLTFNLTRTERAANLPCVSGYDILAVLGGGAMGTVYKARQLSLHRIVALKMPHDSLRTDTVQQARFRIEVETIASLQHPNIVQVYDVGEQEGRPFFTMEYLDGGSLAEHYRGRPQPPLLAAELVETLARALHAVHLKGIVHRDLKPSNVLRNSDGVVKIADFGLARRQASELTASGELLGTPNYMAPEQAAGKVREVGPAADVYALGAILYELLTGRPPFHGATVMDVVRQVQDSDPLPPRKLETRTPRDLDIICLKCLRKEPNRRYAGAGELADDLRRFRHGEAIRARPPSRPERIARWVRRRPAAAALLAVIALAAIVFPLALFVHTLQLQEALQRVRNEREHAQTAEDKARLNESEARIGRFAADVKLASESFNRGDVFQLPGLLDPHRPTDDDGDDIRGFAWFYLHPHGQNARPGLTAHNGPVYLLEYTLDGLSLATAGGTWGKKNSLKVWDADKRTPTFEQSLRWPRPNVIQAAFAPPASLLVGITKPHLILGWRLDSPKPRFQLKPSQDVLHLALSPDGRRLAVSGPLSTELWDCVTARRERTLPTPPGAWLTFAPDGATLMAASNHPSFRGLQWWDADTGVERGQVKVPQGVGAAWYSPRATFVLLIDATGRAAIWDAKQRIPLHWSPRIGPVNCLAVSADERFLAVGDGAGQVRVWDIANGEIHGHYHWQPSAVVRLAFSPDNRTLAAVNSEGRIQQLDVTTRQIPHHLQAAVMNGRTLAWSPDGETVAASAYGGTVHLFDRCSGKIRAVLRCPVQEVRCLAFAADGRTLAVVCEQEPFVRLWDIVDSLWRKNTASHSSPIIAIAFSADGRLASLDGDTIRFWDVTTAAPRGSLTVGPNTRTLAFGSDGALIAAGSAVRVWDVGGDVESNRKAASTVSAGAMVVCLGVSADGRFLVGGGEDGSVRLWELASDRTRIANKTTLLAEPGGGAVRILGFAPDDKTLIVGRGDRVELWNISTRRVRDTIEDPIASAAFSPKETTLAAVGNEGVLRLWQPTGWQVTRPMGQSLEPVKSLVYSADGRTLITASQGLHGLVRHLGPWRSIFHTSPLRSATETLRFWDADTEREKCPDLPAWQTMTPPYVVVCSGDGRLLAAACEDGSIRVLDRRSRQWRNRLFVSDKARVYAKSFELARHIWTNSTPNYREQGESITALAFSPDGLRLLAAGHRGSFRVWDTDDDKECCHWQGGEGGSSWLAFTADGLSVAGSIGGQIYLWDAQTGELRTTLGHETDSPVFCGVFDAKKNVLYFGSKDGAVRIWNSRSGAVKRLMGGHQDRVSALTFAPDGKTLASAGWDRAVRLWNVRAGREVAALQGHKGRIHALTFSPDGSTLASGGENNDGHGEVLLWRRSRR